MYQRWIINKMNLTKDECNSDPYVGLRSGPMIITEWCTGEAYDKERDQNVAIKRVGAPNSAEQLRRYTLLNIWLWVSVLFRNCWQW